MKKNGFAITSIIYAILILFLILVFGLLALLGSRKLVLDKMKNEVMDKLNGDKAEEGLIYTDNSGANAPLLVDNLIPVIYENDNWKVADITKKWYDYDNKEWANAVVLENGVTKNVGDTLDVETEIAQMYVWIPRYEYSIPEHNLGRTDNDISAINIHFINAEQETADEGYNLHPGFVFGDKIVSGLWFGKFETTGATKTSYTNFTCTDINCTQKVTIKPNYMAAYGNVSNEFYAARSIASQYNLNNIDTHMARYTEWTTVSYLTNSIYGRCESATSCMEVTINNDSTYHTGNAANVGITSSNAGISNSYNTNQGKMASTTGNIMGVYDMNGGVWEYVMGVLLDPNGQPRSGYDSSFNSGFNGMLQDGSMYTGGLDFPEAKYYDTFTSSSAGNYSAITHVNGLENDYRGVFRELMTTYTNEANWYGDYAYFLMGGSPWFQLGGDFYSDANAGLFASMSFYGSATNYGFSHRSGGFRVVMVANQ